MVTHTFYLVRHGLKQQSIGDVPLTAEGIRQAQAVARKLTQTPIDLIVTSPLRRARQTADCIAAQIQAPLMEDVRLRERANWGDLPGQTLEQFVEMWDRCTRDPDYAPPVGDSARQAGMRFAECLNELGAVSAASSDDDRHIVIVTHGGLITDLLVHLFREDELNVWHDEFIAKQSQLVPECSITRLIHDNGRYRLSDFASVSHLS